MRKSSSITFKTGSDKLALVLIPVGALAMAALLHFNGRIWWCKLGDHAPYVNEAWQSSHTSQHLFDPYSFTHVLHGVLFFWISGLLFSKLSLNWRMLIASVAEMGWEILENSNFIIEKYRANTASIDYFGDSIANSLGDVIACIIGFWIAAKLGWLRAFFFFIAVEIILLIWIRDGLVLNIIQLLYPIDGIKHWQMSI